MTGAKAAVCKQPLLPRCPWARPWNVGSCGTAVRSLALTSGLPAERLLTGWSSLWTYLHAGLRLTRRSLPRIPGWERGAFIISLCYQLLRPSAPPHRSCPRTPYLIPSLHPRDCSLWPPRQRHPAAATTATLQPKTFTQEVDGCQSLQYDSFSSCRQMLRQSGSRQMCGFEKYGRLRGTRSCTLSTRCQPLASARALIT